MSGGLNSSRLALLVIDMQNNFASAAKPILAEVNATIASARRVGIPVIFSQHDHPDPENEEKKTYDAFYQTRLKSLLDEENVDTVIISRVLTQFCCETISFDFGKVITCAEMRVKFDKISKDHSK